MIGKQKCYLRSLAQKIKPVFQVGKEGIQEKQLDEILNYLKKHELMKVSILETCPDDHETISKAFLKRKIFIVQKIGRTYVLYKENKELKDKIILPNSLQ